MRVGQRVMVLDHPEWRGGKLWGWEGILGGEFEWHELSMRVDFPWLDKPGVLWPSSVFLPRCCVCPVYNDCETCGYGAWGSVNIGTDKAPEIHHYCAWHLTTERDKLAA